MIMAIDRDSSDTREGEMIVCPNCNHQNPDGAVQCEACYTPLPAMMSCPNCGAAVQADASFCGQCGFNLRAAAKNTNGGAEGAPNETAAPDFDIPDLIVPDPLISPEPLVAGGVQSNAPDKAAEVSNPASSGNPTPMPQASPTQPPPAPYVPAETVAQVPPAVAPAPNLYATQIQIQTARLLHLQTNTTLELPQHLSVVHLGKPNDRVPPDIDVSGFPSSEIVSRIHADIRVEGDSYYVEDVGSSNGTYVNNIPLPPGNRHRLRPGDRVALGKGDRVTFLFQLS
jgi:pSer/pThr/pTyr-binding forkhead associated (FHA) protein/ribosomal protein L40E